MLGGIEAGKKGGFMLCLVKGTSCGDIETIGNVLGLGRRAPGAYGSQTEVLD